MAVLNQDDRAFLRRCFERMLELHAGGAVSTSSAMEYLDQVVEAVDRQTADSVQHLYVILNEAWREADA
jgi:hypothetical protein